jgi:dihydroorotate dehydrogenase (NAD+) catalytic subunit
VPIIGTGGVANGMDAIEMIMAGATAVGVGSALVLREKAFSGIADEMRAFMEENGYSGLSQLKLEK